MTEAKVTTAPRIKTWTASLTREGQPLAQVDVKAATESSARLALREAVIATNNARTWSALWDCDHVAWSTKKRGVRS